MDSIKEAFSKVKQDMDNLRLEISNLTSEIRKISVEIERLKELQNPAQTAQIPAIPAHNPANQQIFKPPKGQIQPISTGNGGVPADRQTDRQTDQHIQKPLNFIDSAAEILNSLDSVKKEIRLKFKRLTDQEFSVFSTLYKLDEEGIVVEYRSLAEELNLTESSIRDYIVKLIKKDIPVEKHKINNKTVQLSISPNLKKIATLTTILQLREI